MCVPYLIEIKPTPRKKQDCIHPLPQGACPAPPAKSSPPPCIITIEPRSPKSPRRACTPEKGGIHVRGEASPRGLALEIEREERCVKEPHMPKQKVSPHVPSPKPPVGHSPRDKGRRNSSCSSSSSVVSMNSFRELKGRVEECFRRITSLEKELQADRGRANKNLWIAAGRDDKIEKEVCGMRDSVEGLNKEIRTLRSELQTNCKRDAEDQRPSKEDDGRVRVRWERTRGLPRGTSY
ncbi:MAG: hypothetical protein Q9170_007021 [Blastenia crenularia]